MYKDVKCWILSMNLSTDYKVKLIKCIDRLIEAHANISDLNQKQYNEQIELARASLRGARSKATFDDLVQFDYSLFEKFMLNRYKNWFDRRRTFNNDMFCTA